MIEFNGIRSTALGVFVEKYPPRPVPKRKMERFKVPGRSGDVLFFEEAWENVRQRYDIYLSAEKAGLPFVSAQVVRWLQHDGYAELMDIYDRETFRLAAFIGPADLQNTLNEFGRATIEFDCKPQRFLKSGKQFRPLRSGDVLVNPTGYTASPLIRMPQGGTVSITVINGDTVTSFGFNPGYAGEIIFDSEEKEAYHPGGTAENLNSHVTGEYIMLRPGSTQFIVSSPFDNPVEIAPRWFEL